MIKPKHLLRDEEKVAYVTFQKCVENISKHPKTENLRLLDSIVCACKADIEFCKHNLYETLKNVQVKKSVGLVVKIGETSRGVINGVKERFTRLENKVQGTMVENWLRYWKGVCRDYKDVAVDVAKEIRDKPSKAVLLASTFSLVTYCGKHNPTPTQFRDAFIKSANDVALVHHSLVRDETKEHLKYVESAYNNELLRYTSLGLFTIVWVDNFSRKCSKFETQCSYLQLGYSEILSRVVDIGFLDTWWVLAKKMHDYDVNF